MTASVFWVGDAQALYAFNSWLLALSNETSSEFLEYLSWLRPKACCLSLAKGGVYPDKDGNGIRPFAVNEMTMLAFYHEANFKKKYLLLLPLLPGKDEGLIMKKNNLIAYAVGGDAVGPYAGAGVFDPGLNSVLDMLLSSPVRLWILTQLLGMSSHSYVNSCRLIWAVPRGNSSVQRQQQEVHRFSTYTRYSYPFARYIYELPMTLVLFFFLHHPCFAQDKV